jgi:NADH-quinone oxidoreductase subunit G
VALISNWGSNEELAGFKTTLGDRFTCLVKTDQQRAPGEPLLDDLLIRADKNPNTAGALALFATQAHDGATHFPPDCDLVLVWGEGFSFAQLPPQARIVYLNAWLQPENGHADVFLPISVMTERCGHYTNFAGQLSGFEACFSKPEGVSDAEALFGQLATGAAS